MTATGRRPTAFALALAALVVLIPLMVSWHPPAAYAETASDSAAFAAKLAEWQRLLDKSGSSLLRPNLSEADYEAIHQALSGVFVDTER